MNRRILLTLVVAVVVVAFATVVIASSLTGSPSSHEMPGGQTMEGKIDDGDGMGMEHDMDDDGKMDMNDGDMPEGSISRP